MSWLMVNDAMCNLILQNPLARGEGGRGISLLAHHIASAKRAHTALMANC